MDIVGQCQSFITALNNGVFAHVQPRFVYIGHDGVDIRVINLQSFIQRYLCVPNSHVETLMAQLATEKTKNTQIDIEAIVHAIMS